MSARSVGPKGMQFPSTAGTTREKGRPPRTGAEIERPTQTQHAQEVNNRGFSEFADHVTCGGLFVSVVIEI